LDGTGDHITLIKVCRKELTDVHLKEVLVELGEVVKHHGVKPIKMVLTMLKIAGGGVIDTLNVQDMQWRIEIVTSMLTTLHLLCLVLARKTVVGF
jgi:hypothetical protein